MPRAAATARASAPVINAFDLAKPVETVLAPGAKDAVAKRLTAGLRAYTALCVVKKTVEALIKTSAPAIYEQIKEYAVSEGCRLRRLPPNYKGVEREADASLLVKKKASSQPLTKEEAAVLHDAGITIGRNVLVPQSYIVNPDHMGNRLLVKAVGEMIGEMIGKKRRVIDPETKRPVLVTIPDDIFNIQYEQATDIVSDKSLDEIFENYSEHPQTAGLLLDICAQLSISPEWTGDPRDAATLARDIIFADREKPKEARAETIAKQMEVAAEERKRSILGSGKKRK